LIQEADKFGLIEAIDEPSHKRAQVGSGSGNGMSMPGNIGKQQASDSPGGATGGIVDISAALRLTIGLAENPGFETAELNAL
jgi:hypothetical protein